MDKVKTFIHKWLWGILILFCAIGVFFPIIGSIALLCMLPPILVSFFRGRMWCGSFCPRGSFNDVVLSKISKKKAMPEIVKAKWFRILFLTMLMSAFAIQVIVVWGSFAKVGAVFVRMVFLTTLIAIVLGYKYIQRTWCVICPMGTVAHYVTKMDSVKSKIKHVTFDKEKCISCNLCTKNCPMSIDVLSYKEQGEVTNPDCIKCNKCIEKCPKKALRVE